MPKKILRVSYPEKCIGCELCVFEAQRQKGVVGIEGSPIRIIGGAKKPTIHLDTKTSELDAVKIAGICPKGCFSVEESLPEENEGFMLEGEDSDVQ